MVYRHDFPTLQIKKTALIVESNGETVAIRDRGHQDEEKYTDLPIRLNDQFLAIRGDMVPSFIRGIKVPSIDRLEYTRSIEAAQPGFGRIHWVLTADQKRSAKNDKLALEWINDKINNGFWLQYNVDIFIRKREKHEKKADLDQITLSDQTMPHTPIIVAVQLATRLAFVTDKDERTYLPHRQFIITPEQSLSYGWTGTGGGAGGYRRSFRFLPITEQNAKPWIKYEDGRNKGRRTTKEVQTKVNDYLNTLQEEDTFPWIEINGGAHSGKTKIMGNSKKRLRIKLAIEWKDQLESVVGWSLLALINSEWCDSKNNVLSYHTLPRHWPLYPGTQLIFHAVNRAGMDTTSRVHRRFELLLEPNPTSKPWAVYHSGGVKAVKGGPEQPIWFGERILKTTDQVEREINALLNKHRKKRKITHSINLLEIQHPAAASLYVCIASPYKPPVKPKKKTAFGTDVMGQSKRLAERMIEEKRFKEQQKLIQQSMTYAKDVGEKLMRLQQQKQKQEREKQPEGMEQVSGIAVPRRTDQPEGISLPNPLALQNRISTHSNPELEGREEVSGMAVPRETRQF